MVFDVMIGCRQVEQEERWVSVIGCDEKKVIVSFWEYSVRRGIWSRDLG